jgi:hypothetical protein
MLRRSFLLRIGGVMVAVPAVLHATACGGDDSGPDAINNQTSFGVTSDGSGAPHDHVLTLQCADLDNASNVTYTTSETNGHDHPVTLSPEQLGMIATGATVTVTITDGHTHTWVITRPATACT